MLISLALGALLGFLLAYLTTRSKKDFRKKLLSALESHAESGTVDRFVPGLLRNREQWVKSISLVRKPFGRLTNMVIETIAFVLGLSGVVNGITNFDKTFSNPREGKAMLAFLGLLVAYIPSEWVFSNKIDQEIEAELERLNDAFENQQLDRYIAEARRNWK